MSDRMIEYFDSFDQIANLKREGKFADAFAVAVAACERIPMDRYGFNPGPPCDYLALYAIVHQRRAPLDCFIHYARSQEFHTRPGEYGPSWGAFLTWIDRAYELFEAALEILRKDGVVKQSDLSKRVDAEGRELSTLLYWADRFGVVTREKQGRSYLVSINRSPLPTGS